MAVHWIESGEEVPHAWETSAGPFTASSRSMVALRKAIELPAEISGKASLVLEGDNVDFVEVYLDGEEVERSAVGGGRVELPISRNAAGARVLLAILLKAPATGPGEEVASPRVSIRDRGQVKLLCDQRTVWNHCRKFPLGLLWSQMPPLDELLSTKESFLLTYRNLEDNEWHLVPPGIVFIP